MKHFVNISFKLMIIFNMILIPMIILSNINFLIIILSITSTLSYVILKKISKVNTMNIKDNNISEPIKIEDKEIDNNYSNIKRKTLNKPLIKKRVRKP